jgi:hypothetical protein
MNQAGQQNYAYAQDVASRPLQQYQGQMVAGVAPQTQQAWNLAASSGGVGQDQFGGATAGYLNALGQTPMGVTDPGNAGMIRAGQLSNTNLQPYMNPYTQNVINATLPIMQQNLAQTQNQQANAASAANAFGGSKQGVQAGVTQAQGAQNMAQMAEQLNQANFSQAQGAAQQDIASRLTAAQANQNAQQQNLSRNLQAQQSNQAAQQAKINSDIAASQGLGGLGDLMNKANIANYGLLSSAGAGQSMQAQNQINAQMAKFNQAWNYPQQQLGTLLSALGMTPHDTATTGSQTTETTTPTNWAQLAMGGLDTAAGLWKASDKSLKTDIQPLGKDPMTGIPMHAFRYKGDPKSYPKTVGPMAQDVAKAMPGATAPVGAGKLAIAPAVRSGFIAPKAAVTGALANPRAGARAGTGGLRNTPSRRAVGALAYA